MFTSFFGYHFDRLWSKLYSMLAPSLILSTSFDIPSEGCFSDVLQGIFRRTTTTDDDDDDGRGRRTTTTGRTDRGPTTTTGRTTGRTDGRTDDDDGTRRDHLGPPKSPYIPKNSSYENCSHFWYMFEKMFKHIFKI